jgi:IS5 family transposase
VLAPRRGDKNKIYSLHAPGVLCLAKGKIHKKYEFGNKVALAVTARSGIFVAAESFTENLFDGHTLPAVLDQIEANLGQRPKELLADCGFRGAAHLTDDTRLIIPQAPAQTRDAQRTRPSPPAWPSRLLRTPHRPP